MTLHCKMKRKKVVKVNLLWFLLIYLVSRSQREASSLVHGLDGSGAITNASYSMYCSV